mmetsp:Transcript_43238/g.113764  ORF Transcript_43238/g.113764 Transcript_43238/m.113764 type:complete len:82 (+) Transcript_43238:3-248(+)
MKALTKPLDLQSFIRENRRNMQGYHRRFANMERQMGWVANKLDTLHPSICSRTGAFKSNNLSSTRDMFELEESMPISHFMP